MSAGNTGGVRGALNNAWQQTGGRVGDAIKRRGKQSHRDVEVQQGDQQIPKAPSLKAFEAHLAARSAKKENSEQQGYLDASKDQPKSHDHYNKGRVTHQLQAQAFDAIDRAALAKQAKALDERLDAEYLANRAHSYAMKGIVNNVAADRVTAIGIDENGDAYDTGITKRQLANIERAREQDEAFDLAGIQKEAKIESLLDKMDAAQTKLDALILKKGKLESLFAKLSYAVAAIRESRVIAGNPVSENVAKSVSDFFAGLASHFHASNKSVHRQISALETEMFNMEFALKGMYGIETEYDSAAFSSALDESLSSSYSAGSRWAPQYLDEMIGEDPVNEAALEAERLASDDRAALDAEALAKKAAFIEVFGDADLGSLSGLDELLSNFVVSTDSENK